MISDAAITAALQAQSESARILPGYDSIDWRKAMRSAIEAADEVRAKERRQAYLDSRDGHEDAEEDMK